MYKNIETPEGPEGVDENLGDWEVPGEEAKARKRNKPLNRVINAEAKDIKQQKQTEQRETLGQAGNDAARLEVIVRFAEQNPSHPLAEEIRSKLEELTEQATKSAGLHKERKKRERRIEPKEGLMVLLREAVREHADKIDNKRLQEINAASQELYAKVSSELDPEELHRLAAGEMESEKEKG